MLAARGYTDPLPTRTFPAVVTRLHDGDTWFANVDLGMRNLWVEDGDIRLNGVDAPELATPAGKASLAWEVNNLAPVGTTVILTYHGEDKYGRLLCDVQLADGRDLGKALIAAGQGLPYDGHGPKPYPAG
jgi:endonuclease YncB( thermonuclease family)